jgi:hypothetical protein
MRTGPKITKKISQCQIEKEPTATPQVNGNILHHQRSAAAHPTALELGKKRVFEAQQKRRFLCRKRLSAVLKPMQRH